MAAAELANFIDRFTVEYVRVFPHPIERVWRAITVSAELRDWFMPGEIEPLIDRFGINRLEQLRPAGLARPGHGDGAAGAEPAGPGQTPR